MKNYPVEFFRFFFMLFICLTHFPGKAVIHLEHAYLATDWFFMLSGLFIYKSACKANPLPTFDYSLKKIKRFYPKLVIGCILITLLQPTWLHNTGSLEQIINEWRNVVNELCFIMNIGIFGGGKNPPVWYLTSLVFGGAIIYSFLTYNRRLSLRMFFPLVLVILTYIFGQGDSVAVWGVDGWFYRPFVRGFAGMCIGVFCEYFLQNHQDRVSTRFIDITSILAFFGILFLFFSEVTLDAYVFLFSPFLILSCFYDDSLIHRITSYDVWDKLGGISYDMFILHCPIINAIVLINRYLHLPYTILFLLAYLVIVILASYLFNRCYAAVFKKQAT